MNAPAPSGPPLRITGFRELWLHTGTACNLACPFCHEGSAPADTRIAALAPTVARAAIDEAVARGVRRFVFTGGEPLILRGIVELLCHALAHRPALVLTNGTAPLIRRPQSLAQLRAMPNALGFRVSIDHPDEHRHDAARGPRNFRRALQGLKLLHEAGFTVGVTRLWQPDENTATVESRYREVFRKHGLPVELAIHALPDYARPGAHAVAFARPATTSAHPPACTHGRMLIAHGDTASYLPCPLVDDDPRFALGSELGSAIAAPIDTCHSRCAVCRASGVDYAGPA